jgi:hypothetical protein
LRRIKPRTFDACRFEYQSSRGDACYCSKACRQSAYRRRCARPAAIRDRAPGIADALYGIVRGTKDPITTIRERLEA